MNEGQYRNLRKGLKVQNKGGGGGGGGGGEGIKNFEGAF